MDSGSSTDILSAYLMMEDAMVEDLDQAQGGFQGSTPHSSADSETGFGSHAPVIGGAATRQKQASPVPPTATRHQQPQVQVSANLGRAYSEPASNFYASDNRYTSASLASGATADNWFSRSSAQQSQKLSGSILEGQIVSDEIGLGSSGLHPHRLVSDMGSGAQAPQQWTPPAGAHNAALAMLLSNSGGGRRHSTSSLPEQQSSHALSPLLASLSHEQQQMLVNAGLDPSLLMSVKAPMPAPTANPQLDTAEAVWQHVAASGADDQTLLALAAGLGLITTDANSGAVVLTREMNANSPPLSARGSMFGGGAQQNGSSPQSAPLPRLSQPNLTGLLALQASFNNGTLRLPPGSPGLKNVCGSPGPSKQHTLYKTELCRGWLETGACRYGSKCQFAHGRDELRPVPRHPKYKTEVCRSFTATGVCAYGPRCRFIHGINSAPNALFDGCGRMVDSGMEGVLGFDDLPAISPSNAAADAGGGPRKQLLSAVSGGSAALRQAAGGNSAAAAHDAASMAKIAARLLGNGGRGSLDSSMSMATVARASWSEVNRASMDSRTGGNNNNGGRMSLESCMSQGDVMMAREMMLMGGASSNERLNGASSSERLSTGESNTICYSSPSHHQGLTTDALLSLSASLAAGGGGGMHQPFMPGIPEGCAMTLNSLPADPWAGIPTAGSQAAQQLRGAGGDGGAYNVPFNFLMPRGSTAQEHPDTSGFMLNNMPAPQQGPAAGTWWDPATSAANNKQRAVAEQLVASSLHMSAYKSGLYAPVQSATQQQQQQQQVGGGKQQGFGPSPRASYPGVLTPEKSENSLEPTSDLNLRS